MSPAISGPALARPTLEQAQPVPNGISPAHRTVAARDNLEQGEKTDADRPGKIATLAARYKPLAKSAATTAERPPNSGPAQLSRPGKTISERCAVVVRVGDRGGQRLGFRARRSSLPSRRATGAHGRFFARAARPAISSPAAGGPGARLLRAGGSGRSWFGPCAAEPGRLVRARAPAG